MKSRVGVILAAVAGLLSLAITLNWIIPPVALYLNTGILLICCSMLLTFCFDSKPVTQLIVLTFIFRLALAFFAEFGLDPGLPGRLKNANAFLQDGYYIFLNWNHPELNMPIRFDYEKWPQIIASIYDVLGPNFLNVLIFNCFLGSLVVYEIYRSTALVWNKKVAIVAAAVYSFIPYIAGLSAVALREMVILYPAVLSFRYYLSWRKERHILLYFKAFIASIVAVLFHGGLIVLLLVYLVSFFRNEVKLNTKKGLTIGVLGVLMTSVILVSAFKLEIGRSKLGFFYRLYAGTNEADETFINLLASGIELKSSSSRQYRKPFIPTSYLDFAKHIPNYIIPYYFYPYPWLTYRSYFSLLNGIFSLFCFIGLILFRKEIVGNELARITLITSILVILIYAVGTTEYAAAVRHRSKAMPFMAIAFAPFFGRVYHFLFNGKRLYLK